MRPDFGDEFKLDGKLVRIIAEDVYGDELVVMDTGDHLTFRVHRGDIEFCGKAEFKTK